jgi:hypothetical protein
VLLTIELKKSVEDKCSLRNNEVQLTIELEDWYKKTAVCEAWSTTAIKLENLSFLMNTSYCREHLKNQEDFATRKKVSKEEAGVWSGNSSTDSVNSGSGQDYEIYIPLG